MLHALLFAGRNRLGYRFVQRVEEQLGLRSNRAVASAERASASAEFFMDTGPAAEIGNTEGHRDEEDHDGEDQDHHEDEDDDVEDKEQEEKSNAPLRPARARKPAARGGGFVDPTSPGLSSAKPKSPSRSGKRKASEKIEELDLAVTGAQKKEEGEEAEEPQSRKTRSTSGSAKKKLRTRSHRK